MTNDKLSEQKVDNPVFINNAGIVLFSPFIPRLFAILGLTEQNIFKNPDAQITAMFILQYAIFEQTAFPERDMELNKLLTGFKTDTPIPFKIALSEHEREATNNMIKGVLQHWSKLRNTSMEGLREAFLKREGKLEEKDDAFLLTIEAKAYDMLLDSIPWSFRIIKYPWMTKPIRVNWR